MSTSATLRARRGARPSGLVDGSRAQRPPTNGGEAFDPTRHEAITAVPAASPDQDGLVVGVVRHGYQIGDDVLRPATVAVATATTESRS